MLAVFIIIILSPFFFLDPCVQSNALGCIDRLERNRRHQYRYTRRLKAGKLANRDWAIGDTEGKIMPAGTCAEARKRCFYHLSTNNQGCQVPVLVKKLMNLIATNIMSRHHQRKDAWVKRMMDHWWWNRVRIVFCYCRSSRWRRVPIRLRGV